MIMINNQRDERKTDWQTGFTEMLPELEPRLRRAFRHLDAEAREDATQIGIVHCLLAYISLVEQGREQTVRPSSLAWVAKLQVSRGREAGCPMNSLEPLSRYAQLRRGIRAEPLQTRDMCHGKWVDSMVLDKRASVPDLVAARMDVRAWLATLSQRTRRIAKDLAYGFSTAETARKYGVTAGRISQLRRTLEQSWAAFQQ